MSDFIVRIELHRGGARDYDALHRTMVGLGFARTGVANDGKRYQLPTGEYHLSQDMVLGQVRELAVTAARSTGKTFSILASECTAIDVSQLPVV